jgi:hypothetical protein
MVFKHFSSEQSCACGTENEAMEAIVDPPSARFKQTVERRQKKIGTPALSGPRWAVKHLAEGFGPHVKHSDREAYSACRR